MMQPRKLRATVIGGSNTLMGSAYIAEVPKCARLLGIELELVANLAIGNTGSLTGLMRLKSGTQLQESDCLIIEYALNDVSLYGDDRAGLEAWAKAYEGIIRYALSVNPDIRILSAVLYNQQGAHRSTVPPLPAAIGYLSEWYGLTTVDLHCEFSRRFGAGYSEVAGFYQDPAHYSRPVFTRLLAEVVAEGIGRAMQRAPRTRPLPPPVDAGHYQDARVVACATAWQGLPAASFKNSIYAVEAVDLCGGDVRLRVQKGRLLSALFACTPDVSRLYVEVDGTTHECATLRPSIRDGKFKFLLAAVNLEVIPAPAAEGDGLYRLSIDPPAGGGAAVARQRGAVAHVDVPETCFPLVSLMHTGTLAQAEILARRPARMPEAA